MRFYSVLLFRQHGRLAGYWRSVKSGLSEDAAALFAARLSSRGHIATIARPIS